MTTKPETRRKRNRILEDIRTTVHTIEHRLYDAFEDIRDKLDECLDRLHYQNAWHEGYELDGREY